MIKVLIVDDYAEHVDTLVNTCNMYGCESRGCAFGDEALKIVAEWQPDLIVYDGLLTGMHAWKFGYALFKGEPEKRPYLVALTGFASTLHRRLCEECGYDEYVTKPIELSVLLTWIQKARQRSEGAGHSLPDSFDTGSKWEDKE